MLPGVTMKGFSAAGVACGIKKGGQPDLALIVSDRPAYASGVFTTNRVKAAPVLYDQQVLAAGGAVRAVVINAGNANAVTGEQGMTNTREMARLTAEAIGCVPREVLVMSTGVIGVQLPMKRVAEGIKKAAAALSPEGWADAARAIMTTDTHPKISQRQQGGWGMRGIAKGSGMIAPNMATMLGLIVTDSGGGQHTQGFTGELRSAAAGSFNRIVVDGDMSTNDTVLLLANGAAGIYPGDPFQWTLDEVCSDLARAIVRDGEGATKLVEVHVSGAASADDAAAAAHAVATSPLCKTAFYGEDPNWGRFLAAVGRSGAAFDPSQTAVRVGDITLLAGGEPQPFEENAAKAVMQQPEWRLTLELGAGTAHTTVWTCDLSHDYISINADYRT
jgi:glutamate N-acetyltransferase/amino-acid N-acetyltransferase